MQTGAARSIFYDIRRFRFLYCKKYKNLSGKTFDQIRTAVFCRTYTVKNMYLEGMEIMENYVTLSLETHLFFARIMKEHALFLEAGFPCADKKWMERAEEFRCRFEDLLRDTVRISNGRVNREILQSCELATKYTISAEERTKCLTGVEIDSKITEEVKELRPGRGVVDNREIMRTVHNLNQRSLRLLDELIEFKENILEEVKCAKLFTTNYPLLIRHILREARLYRATVETLMNGRRPSYQSLRNTEEFWNRIMMEHALFIRGLLDPTEEKLICKADCFAGEYKELLEKAREQDCMVMNRRLAKESLEETLKYREFKEAGAEGILDCEIASVILPLLADHVLREANHYIRLLESACAD